MVVYNFRAPETAQAEKKLGSPVKLTQLEAECLEAPERAKSLSSSQKAEEVGV